VYIFVTLSFRLGHQDPSCFPVGSVRAHQYDIAGRAGNAKEFEAGADTGKIEIPKE